MGLATKSHEKSRKGEDDGVPTVIHVVISLEVGGLEGVVVDLTNDRNRRFPGSTFICCLDGKGALASRVDGDVVSCVEANRSRFPWDTRAVERMKKQIKLRFQVSSLSPLLHSHNLAAQQYAVLAARGMNMKHVYTQHGANPHNLGFKDRLRSRILSRFTDGIVAVSQSTADVMARRQGIERRRIRVVPNGVRLDSYQTPDARHQKPGNEERRRLGIGENAFVVGSVGRFSPEKNYPLLVRAFSRFLHCHSPIVPQSHLSCEAFKPSKLAECSRLAKQDSPILLLIGDGPDRARIEKTIDKCAVRDHCVLTGIRDDIDSCLEAMDVFCLSSDIEGLSVSLLKAGAHSLPSIVTDVGGNPEVVINNESGLVVVSGDEVALAQAIEELSQDDALAKRMGESLRRRIENNYSFDLMFESYEQVYREC